MTEALSPDAARAPLLPTLRRFAGSRRGMVLIAAAVLSAGAALNWGWLVAAGIAPLLISVLPCVAMCALGLCMMGGKCKRGAGVSEEAAHVHRPAAGRPADAPAPLVIDGRTGDAILQPRPLPAARGAAMLPVGRRNPFKPQRRFEDA